jgi:hypothetical protein
VRRLADHFGVSVAFLAGEDRESNDADPQIQRMFRQASELGASERDLLDQMMQAMLKQKRDRDGG